MLLVPYILLLFSTLLVSGTQLRNEKVHLSDLTREVNQGNLRESKRSQELDKNIWEEELGENVSWRLMWERWEGRMKAKKERLETQKIERCLLQGVKILISGSKMSELKQLLS